MCESVNNASNFYPIFESSLNLHHHVQINSHIKGKFETVLISSNDFSMF